ncbi:MAG: hypothetical protein R8P61_28135 [Bacteroidia bacterium]|nr:hypothetical protein [Bacteroidia bacterium]
MYNRQFIRIRLRDGPFESYYQKNLKYPLEFPLYDEQVWLAKCQLSMVYGVPEKKVEYLIPKILLSLHQSEADYHRYFPVVRFGNHSSQYKFYRIDLALLVGRAIGSDGYYRLKAWLRVKFDI